MKAGLKLIGASTLTFALSASAGLTQSTQDEGLILFAGPQAVTPGQPIFLTAEVKSDKTRSEEFVTLLIGEAGDRINIQRRTENGIANFVVPGPSQAGRITFLALTSTMMSYEAEVLVVSDQPQKFDVLAQQHSTDRLVATSTSTVQDQFQNIVENGVMADIHWLENGRLIFSEQTTLQDGKVSIFTRCEDIKSVSHVSVRVRQQQVTAPVSLTWCLGN